MAEYIAKEEALRVISDVFFETDPDGREQLVALKCSRLVRELPAADVAPVVRCKDCKHYLGLAECEFEGHFSGGTNYFCSYGERKNGTN